MTPPDPTDPLTRTSPPDATRSVADAHLDAGLAAAFGGGDTTRPLPPPPDPQAGTLLAGKYKLSERIGEGGMGSVWAAQQVHPVKRKVAVKLIKAGMDSKQVLARFEAERQALAVMDHPNVAKVLDAGTTPDGRPFFVMELVKGVPITRYCDARKLTPKERLELFVPVCHALQHAHQKGIIHRDIKPSNVLVALYDDKPVPKVIDFGIAKAAGGGLTEHTLDTAFGAVVGTPAYMSPEQASLNNLDIDTRSDVYSLGVLLYELLAGSPPFAAKELEKRGVLEMLRVVREEEPPKPSAKLSTADALPTLSANRGTDPKALTGLLRSELDWVVMKALEKDRGRRYETANGFAADILRYLSGEPVQAHPPTAAYRLRKFARKHRGPLLAAAVVFAALVAGVVGTAAGLIQADEKRREAEQARADEAEQRAKAVSAADEARAATTRTEMAFDNAVDQFVSTRTLPEYGGGLDGLAFGPNEKEFLAVLDKHYVGAAAAKLGAARAAALVRSGLIRRRLKDLPGLQEVMSLAVREWEFLVAAGGPDVAVNRHGLARVLDRYAEIYPIWSDTDKGVAKAKLERTTIAADYWRKLAMDFPNEVEHHLGLSGALETHVSTLGQIRLSATSTPPEVYKEEALLRREGAKTLDRAVALRPNDPKLRDKQYWRYSETLASYRNAFGLNPGDATLKNGIQEVMETQFLAAAQAAERFPETRANFPDAIEFSNTIGNEIVHTFESRLLDLVLGFQNVVATPDSLAQLAAVWSKVVVRMPNWKYGESLKLVLAVKVSLAEFNQSPAGEQSLKLAKAKDVLASARRRARDSGLVFPPSSKFRKDGVLVPTSAHEEFDSEQRLLLEWAEAGYTALPVVEREAALTEILELSKLAGKPLSPRTKWYVMVKYYACVVTWNKTLTESADEHRQAVLRSHAAIERLISEDPAILKTGYILRLAIGSLVGWGRLLVESDQPALALAKLDAAVKVHREWVAGEPLTFDDRDMFVELEKAHSMRGDVLSKLVRPKEAAAAFAESLASADRFIESAVKTSTGRMPNQAESMRASRLDTYFRCGSALLAAGNDAEAATVLERAVAIRDVLYRASLTSKDPWPSAKDTHRDLCWAQSARAYEYYRAGKWELAAKWYEESAKSFADHDKRFFTDSDYKKQWEAEIAKMRRLAHANRAVALEYLKRNPEALKEFDSAEPLVPDTDKLLFGVQRARQVALLGDHAAAAKTATDALASANPSTAVLYEAACVYALAADTGKADDKFIAKYADDSMAALKKAVAAGYADWQHMKKDTDLDHLRERNDFKKLLADLEAKFPPPDPPKPEPKK